MHKFPCLTRATIVAISFLALLTITYAGISQRDLPLIASVREFLGSYEDDAGHEVVPEPPTEKSQEPEFSKSSVLAGDQFFAGDGSSIAGSKWAPTSAGPFVDAFVFTNTANFAKVDGTGTGASTTVAGINAVENFRLTSAAGTISNIANGVIPVTVASGKTLDLLTQSLSGSPNGGYRFTGPGVFATSGNTYGGGFTINSGTLVSRGVNAMGGSITNTLTINGGTIASSATRDFTGKFGGGIIVGGNFQLGERSANVPISVSGANLTFSNNVDLGAATPTITIGGTGVYLLAGVISGASGVGLTVDKTAGGSGAINLSGVNTYTGNTTIIGGSLGLQSAGSIAASPVIEIGGGGIFDIRAASGSVTLAAGQALRASGTSVTGTLNLSSTRSLTMSSSGPLQFTAFNGTIAPLTISGAGTLALQTDEPVTVTVSHGGIPLGTGDYKLIAKGTGAVTGTPTSLTVGGDGVSGTATLVNTGGELFLHVAAGTPTITTDTASTGFTGSFGDVVVGSDSAEQHYKVSGTNIGAGGILVTAPDGFQISPSSGFGFGSSFTVAGSGTIPATDVFVRFHPTSAGSVSGDVVNSATAATTLNVPVTGNGVLPVLNVANDPTVSEGNAGTTVATFNVTLTPASSQTVTVHYATQDNGATAADGDYIALPDAMLTFDPGESSKNISVTVNGDTIVEPDEQFFFKISLPSNAGISDDQGIGTITNDDTTMQFAKSVFSGAETSTVLVTVSRDGDLSGTSSVAYATSNGNATSGTCGSGSSDYVASSGTLNFAPSVTSQSFVVPLCGDMITENPAETVHLTLSSASGGTLGGQDTATLDILDAATQFVNNTLITATPGNSSSPYPSTIEVSGFKQNIARLRVTLFDVNWATSNTLYGLLIGPGGQNIVLIADVGGNFPLSGSTITLDDVATNFMPANTPIIDGQNYRPTTCQTPILSFPSPAPSATYNEPGCGPAPAATFGNVFGNTSPNGTWSLYIEDQNGAGLVGGSVDSIGGWGIQFLVPTAARAGIDGQVRTRTGSGIRNAMVTVAGGDLLQPITLITSTFGYYHVKGLTAGQAYIVSVTAKKYTFAESVRAVQLLEDTSGVDFVADR